MSRDEKITFVLDAIYEVEGVRLPTTYFDKHTDEQLDSDVKWYDYLLGK